jgi:CarD family transcriptional regulator
MGKNLAFAEGDYVVYPSHGVGRITMIESQEIAGDLLEMYVVSFEQDRLILRVPTAKAPKSGMRKLSSRDKIQNAMNALKARPRPRRAVMWSRRAQEYEAKINSGDPISIAEVVRDLHRDTDQPDRSYSERQLYEAALERLAREFAAVEQIEPDTAAERLETMLAAA